MGRHVARLAASAVEKVWLDACLFGDLRDRVPDALSGDPVARPRRNSAGESFQRLLRYDDSSRVTSEASSNVAGAGLLSLG